MSDRFEDLEREQVKMRRDLADKLDKGGLRAQARAAELRELADRMEQQIGECQPTPQMCTVDDISSQQPCQRVAQWIWQPDPDDHPVFLCNFHAEPLTSDMARLPGRPWPYDGPNGRARLTGNLGVEEP